MEFFGMDMASFISVLALAILIAVFFFIRKDNSYDAMGPVSTGRIKKAAGPENRQHPRLDISWPVIMDTSQGKVQATMSNISVGGAFIACDEPLPMYEQFTLNIDLEEESHVTITAEVLWSNSNVADDMIQNRGMGIRFVHNTDDAREFLNKKIDQLTEKETDNSEMQP